MALMSGYDVLGDDVLGDEDELDDLEVGLDLVGAPRKAIARARQKPRWRNRLAPGVPVPDYGVFPVPLTPQAGNGVFSASLATITYRAIAQVPFRGERLLTTVTRDGAAGVQCFAQNGVFIGIRPQQGVLGPLNLENYTKDAFGVRFVMQAAEQGAELQVFAFVNPAITGTTDTLTLSIEILGRVAR